VRQETICRGSSPNDSLWHEPPTTFEQSINMKTAKVPSALWLQADQVFE
jgi:hypothetical protein